MSSFDTHETVLLRSIRWNSIAALAIAVGGGIIGYLAVGWTGVWSALAGAAVAAFFAILTALSILLTNRFAGQPSYVVVFLSVMMGGWFVKLVLFFVVALVLRGQPWADPTVLFCCVIVGVLASLVVDVVVVARGRVPYVLDPK